MHIALGKLPMTARFADDSLSIWCGSLIKGDDGLFHMFYSTWPKRMGWAWVTHSVIKHAVSSSPFGPFAFRDVVLPVRGAQFWDGLCTHNPTIHRFGEKYYLYYMGNTGDGINPNTEDLAVEKLNFVHRNNQRIGVAVADSPDGPWTRFDKPIIDVAADSTAADALVVTNPAIVQRPDGTFLMIYKAVGKKRPLPFGGPVVHLAATSESPTGPFVKHDGEIFTVHGVDFPAEDPYVWFQNNQYFALLKSMRDSAGANNPSLVLYNSPDGITWRRCDKSPVSDRTIQWQDGRSQTFLHLERPQLLFEGDTPYVLVCAADTLDVHGVRQTFSVQIPILVSVPK
ncbi:glycoside hydrolase family protein [Chryseolinea lacunae]|uniref:Glycoside hydrolase family protein n=1 Tax=Chryseolinea lacunae TaxID=2801331 RepID=A0ABS1L234_9BACT|nr:glycoside hydrolase family protein [Chryseolinea lacunae]MBL0745769.1 glycoside hydrolase family protein [Chryseolinea lacunae]